MFGFREFMILKTKVVIVSDQVHATLQSFECLRRMTRALESLSVVARYVQAFDKSCIEDTPPHR